MSAGKCAARMAVGELVPVFANVGFRVTNMSLSTGSLPGRKTRPCRAVGATASSPKRGSGATLEKSTSSLVDVDDCLREGFWCFLWEIVSYAACDVAMFIFPHVLLGIGAGIGMPRAVRVALQRNCWR